MTKEEHKTSLLTALATCAALDQNKTLLRERFTYVGMPFIGSVCKLGFESVYQISDRTLHLYRKRVRDEEIFGKPHVGDDNTNPQKLDDEVLVAWFTMFANIVGDIIPVHVRLKEVKNGLKRRYFSYDQCTITPADLRKCLFFKPAIRCFVSGEGARARLFLVDAQGLYGTPSVAASRDSSSQIHAQL